MGSFSFPIYSKQPGSNGTAQMEDVSKVEFAQSYKAVQNDINPNKCTICFFGEIPATSPPIRMSWIFVHGYLIWSIQGTMHLRRPHNDFVNFCRFFCFMVKYPPFRATNQRFGHYFLTSQSTFCLGLSERLAARRAMSFTNLMQCFHFMSFVGMLWTSKSQKPWV